MNPHSLYDDMMVIKIPLCFRNKTETFGEHGFYIYTIHGYKTKTSCSLYKKIDPDNAYLRKFQYFQSRYFNTVYPLLWNLKVPWGKFK